MENNFPCECGHSKDDHVGFYIKADKYHCPKEIGKFGWLTFYCECKNYKPSNLKYLEKLYDSKIK